jgi:hypothetical protein
MDDATSRDIEKLVKDLDRLIDDEDDDHIRGKMTSLRDAIDRSDMDVARKIIEDTNTDNIVEVENKYDQLPYKEYIFLWTLGPVLAHRGLYDLSFLAEEKGSCREYDIVASAIRRNNIDVVIKAISLYGIKKSKYETSGIDVRELLHCSKTISTEMVDLLTKK